MLDSANKIKGVALAVAIALHGVAGFGVANMQIKTLIPPKITPPLEVEFIKPEPEKIILNNLESPTPVAVNQPVQQQVARKQEEGAAAPVKTKPMSEPRVRGTEPKKSKPIPKSKPDHKIQDDLLQQQARQAAFETEQRRLANERLEQERLAKEQAQKERLAKEQAERDEAQKRARAAAAAAAAAHRQAQGQGKQGGGKDKKNDDSKKGGKDENNQQGQIISGQNLGTISNASWIRKPNFDGVSSDEIKGNVSVTATLTIDAKGSITGVSGVSTGDRELDRQIAREIRRAKLKPFKQGNNILTGQATYPISIKLSNKR